MAILDKTAPRFLPPGLRHDLVALYQGRHAEGLKDELPTCLQALSNRLWAATESGALSFTVPDVPGKPHWKELRTPRVIHRSDYTAWLATIGEPPPVWWRCEGDPIAAAIPAAKPESTQKREDFWRSAMKAAAKEFRAKNGRPPATWRELWERMVEKPPTGYSYTIGDDGALKSKFDGIVTREAFVKRWGRLPTDDR